MIRRFLLLQQWTFVAVVVVLLLLSIEKAQAAVDCGNEYREYKSGWLSTTPQYGAPDGCLCVDGMSSLHCGYCDIDDVGSCQRVSASHKCYNDISFLGPRYEETYKSYTCRLIGPLSDLFIDGKIAVYANLTQRTVEILLYGTADFNNGEYSSACLMERCDFSRNNDVGCEVINCNCTEKCSDFTRGIFENTLSGNPVRIAIDPNANSFQEGAIDIKVEGSPFPLTSLCNATSCALDPSDTIMTDDDVEIRATKETTTFLDSNASAIFSFGILCATFSIFITLTICAFIPSCYCLNTHKKKNHTTKDFETRSLSKREGSNQEVVIDNDSDNQQPQEEEERLTLSFSQISKSINDNKKNQKVILQDISATIESGTILGIMGPSGAGKSSLLNILAAVDYNASTTVSGEILWNGTPPTNTYRQNVGYVHQDDGFLYETLTVRESIEYSALLRLSSSTSYEEKQQQIDAILDELHIKDIANSRIGSQSSSERGISGGERKRVSIAMELVTQPRVLILDEPTSGLDSFSSNTMIRILCQLAHNNKDKRMVILSIHQPSTKIFYGLDQVMVIGGQGRLLYHGTPTDAEQYFEDASGLSRPSEETFPEHMLNIVSDTVYLKTLLLQINNSSSPPPEATIVEQQRNYLSEGKKERRISIIMEVFILLGRTRKDILRNNELFVLQNLISIILALFVGGVFNDVSDNLAGFQNRMGAFYFTLSFFAFTSFSSMDAFLRERHIFIRESGALYFRPISYFLSRTVLDIFLLRITPVTIFSFIFYYLMGLRTGAFIVFWTTFVLFTAICGILSTCISIAMPTVGQANLVAAVWFLLMLLFGGFLVNIESLPVGFGWIQYTSIFYYSFELCMTNELSGTELLFDAPGFPVVPVYGEVYLETIGLNYDHQFRDLLCLCSLMIGFYVSAYGLLLLRAPPNAITYFQGIRKNNTNNTNNKPTKSEEEKNKKIHLQEEKEQEQNSNQKLKCSNDDVESC